MGYGGSYRCMGFSWGLNRFFRELPLGENGFPAEFSKSVGAQAPTTPTVPPPMNDEDAETQYACSNKEKG